MSAGIHNNYKTLFKVLIKGSLEIAQSGTQRRHWQEWLKSHTREYLMSRPMPWIVYDAYEYLQAHVPQNAKVFEYGSGASTLYWLQCKNAECTAIEHDVKWHTILSEHLRQTPNAHQVTCKLIEPEVISYAVADPFDPQCYADETMPGYSFERYVKQIDDFPDNYFDVIMVDGRSRPACIVHSICKVKRGGLLILDNSDRASYFNHTQRCFDGMERHRFRGVLPGFVHDGQTDVYINPSP